MHNHQQRVNTPVPLIATDLHPTPSPMLKACQQGCRYVIPKAKHPHPPPPPLLYLPTKTCTGTSSESHTDAPSRQKDS